MATLLILFVLILMGIFSMGIYSHKAPEPGLIDGKLSPCPDKPNCVCSETDATNTHHIRALSSNGADHHVAWGKLIATVKSLGGDIQQRTDTYLHATFTSSLFHFVDDLEVRLDTETDSIHVRSASRVGHSDFGVNRQRVEQIRLEYDKVLSRSI